MASVLRRSAFDGVQIMIGDSRVQLSDGTYVDEGGEAEVHRINATTSVKIYKEALDEVIKNKLTILCEKSPTFHPAVVAPQELVVRPEDDTVVGFSMRFLSNAQKLEDYFWHPDIKTPEDRFDQQIANMLYDICDGLKAIHRSRVVVGDLKPDNILVSQGKAFVVDFDSASLLPEYPAASWTDEPLVTWVDPRLKSTIEACGPFAFDPESDWWTLGSIAFAMFLGTDPWGGFHPKLRNKQLRAFNYSVVGFDSSAGSPPSMRGLSWFDDKRELKRYFQNLFSVDFSARYSIDYILERYFPRPRQNRIPEYVASSRSETLRKPLFTRELKSFTGAVVRDIEKAKLRRSREIQDERNVFLNFILDF